MREYPSLIGQRFGKLTVIEQLPSTKTGQRRWRCICDCGGEHIATSHNLNSGKTTNCGCKKSPDLTGKVFGRLTVIGRSDKRNPRGARTTPMWECRCECGNITYKATDTLTNPDESMCQECHNRLAPQKARESAGFVEGTQLSKIKDMTPPVLPIQADTVESIMNPSSTDTERRSSSKERDIIWERTRI